MVVDYLTHYYRRGTEPFRSLSTLADLAAMQIMKELYVEGSVIWERFKDPAQYLQARRQTEQWLRQEFMAKGGSPQETCPIYMVLGRSQWVLRMADAATLATTAEIQVPLSIFGEGDVSFTYPDSMISWWLGTDKPAEYYQPDYHGKVFTLSEIRSLIAMKGLPEEGWETNLPSSLAHYIEAQVWNHKLLLAYKRQFDDDKYSKLQYCADKKYGDKSKIKQENVNFNCSSLTTVRPLPLI
jgi:hypothetical protein